MTFSMNTGLTSITGNVTAVTQSYTVSIVAGSRTSAGTTTLGTVPALKKWTIISLNFTATISGGSSNRSASVQANGVNLSQITSVASAIAMNSTSNTWEKNCAPVITAGQTLTLITSASEIQSDVTICYVEETA